MVAVKKQSSVRHVIDDAARLPASVRILRVRAQVVLDIDLMKRAVRKLFWLCMSEYEGDGYNERYTQPVKP